MKIYEFDEKTREIYEKQKIPFAIYQYADSKINILLVSDGLCSDLGFSRERFVEASKMHKLNETHPDDADGMTMAFIEFFKSEDKAKLDIIYRAKKYTDVDFHIIHAQGEHIFMEDGTRLEQIWYIDETIGKFKLDDKDVEMVKYLEGRAFNTRSYYDALTELPNMNYFMELTSIALENSREENRKLTVCALNLCGLKSYNSRYGLEEGDNLICMTADIIRKYFSNENASRFGEDRFFFYEYADEIEKKLYRLFEDMKKANNGRTLPVRVGIYVFDDTTSDVSNACDNARIAADWNRNNYTSRYTYFDDQMHEAVKNKSYVINNLNRAVRENHIKVYYQPQIRLLNGKVYGAEALARWDDPEYGFLMPNIFIPILEDANLTYKLDIYVIKQVVAQLKTLLEKGVWPVPVSFNLSRTDFKFMDPAKFIRKIADDNAIPHELLRIEITESTVMEDPEGITEQIKRFHEFGFEVLMDDFGSGYSSLNTLRDFDFDEIKIDKGFIKNFDDRGKEIVKSIILMAKKLGIHTLMEGVETEEQIEFLQELGCEIIQGYYYSCPMPFSKATANLRKQGINDESSEEKIFFNKVGLVNVITEQPIALFFYDGQNFKLYYSNDKFINEKFGGGYKNNSDDLLPAERKAEVLRNLRLVADRAVSSGEREQRIFVVDNKYYKLECKDIAGYERGHMQLLSYYNITAIENEHGATKIDSALRNIITVYTNVYAIDFDKDEIETIVTDNIFEQDGGSTYSIDDVLSSERQLENIYPSDRKTYKKVINRDYILGRLKGNTTNFSELFRVRVGVDCYKWMEYMFMIAPNFENERVILCLRTIETDNEREIMQEVKRIMGQYIDMDILENENGVLKVSEKKNDNVVWNNFVENTDLKFFWKDKDRRFLGASRAFLNYYGFKSLDMILGKTDEEMGWHPDDGPYHNDEYNVIKRGETIKNSAGQIIVKGVVKNIQATKFPLIKDGEIIGLIGYFVDADSILTPDSKLEETMFVDSEIALMNVRGFYLALQGYDDNFRTNNVPYGIAVIEVPEYSNIYVAYGKKIADKFAKGIVDTIRESFGGTGCVALLRNCCFAVAERNVTREQMESYAKSCVRNVKYIRDIDGFGFRVTAAYGIAMSDESKSMQQLIGKSMTRASNSRTDSKGIDRMITSAIREIPDFYRDLPLPFMASRVIYDESGRIPIDLSIVFVNKKYLEISGKRNEDLIGKRYMEQFPNSDDAWITYAARASRGETVTGRAYGGALGHWLGFSMSESSIPGCINNVMWVLDEELNDSTHKFKEHEAYNTILRIVRHLNDEPVFEKAVKRCLSEVGKVVRPDRIKMLDVDGNTMYEWHADGIFFDDISDKDMYWDPQRLNEDFGDKNVMVVSSLLDIEKKNHELMEFMGRRGIHNYMLAKITVGGEFKGILSVENYDIYEMINTRRLLEETAYFISSKMTS
ncbi:MAG: EAL domain-containing protein [Lachnospiraceae bacterium]|nr:EAL domain-containing protein [Lachnospiraceae bacterium]